MVEVTTPFKPFLTVPEVNTPFTPASNASGHPSPSESKSKLLGIPSPSKSGEGPPKQFAGSINAKPWLSVLAEVNKKVCLTFKPVTVPITCTRPMADVEGVLAPSNGFVEMVKMFPLT